ncbi:MAG: hypothetical protein WAW37_13560 [Syntrophobacteraceae bacterium]
MTDENRFKGILSALGELYDKDISKALAELYWRALADYTNEEVEHAVHQGVRRWKCFRRIPTPAEIIDEIEGRNEQQALGAWLEVQRAAEEVQSGQGLIFVDPKVTQTVDALGGWDRMAGGCKGKDAQFLLQKFLKVYTATTSLQTYELGDWRWKHRQGKGEVPSMPPKVIGTPEKVRAFLESGGLSQFQPESKNVRLLPEPEGHREE